MPEEVPDGRKAPCHRQDVAVVQALRLKESPGDVPDFHSKASDLHLSELIMYLLL